MANALDLLKRKLDLAFNQTKKGVVSAVSNLQAGADNLAHFQPNNPFESAAAIAKNIPYVQKTTTNQLANFALNEGKAFLEGVTSFGKAGNNIKNGNYIQSIGNAVSGVGQVLSPFTPMYQAANAVASARNTGKVQRTAAGVLRGMSGSSDTASNVQENKSLNIPFVGGVDPFMAAGEAVGFVNSPLNKKFFSLTESLLPATLFKTPVGKWLGITAARGGIENLALSLGNYPTSSNPSEKLNFLVNTLGSGAAQEIIGRGIMDSIGKGVDLAKSNEELDRIYGKLTEGLGNLTAKVNTNQIDPKTGQRIQKPMWQYLAEKNGFGLSTQDINSLSDTDLAKVKADMSLALPENSTIPLKVKTAKEARKMMTKGFKNLEYVPKSTTGKGVLSTKPPQDISPDWVEVGNDGLPNFKADISNSPKKGVLAKVRPLVDNFVLTGRKILNDMGDYGKEANAMLDNFHSKSGIVAGNAVADLEKATRGLSESSVENIYRFLDGQDVKLNQVELNAAKVARSNLDKFSSMASNADIKINRNGEVVDFVGRENYLPHITDVDKLKAHRDETIKYLVSTAQIPDVNQASMFVDEVISGGSVSEAYHKYFPNALPRTYGNLEMSRVLDMPENVLRYDKKLLADYFEAAARRISKAETFGPKNEKVTALLTRIGLAGGDTKTAEEIMLRDLGDWRGDKSSLKAASGLVRQVEATTKLGLSVISNAAQSVNTASVLGLRRTLSEIIPSIKDPAKREFALRSGNILEQTMKDMETELGTSGVMNKITAPGFATVEKFNRVLASNVGKNMAEDAFSKLQKNPLDKEALKNLEKLGLNATEIIKRGSLSEMDLFKAAQKAVDLTQFRVNPRELPPAWNGPMGRLLSQFKTFSYKQGEFALRELIKPAISGNVKPLATYLILGLIVGEGIADTKAAVRGRERPTNPAERMLDNISNVGGVGILGDALTSAQRGPEAVLSFLSPPVISDVAKLYGNAGLAVQGKPSQLIKQLISNIPVVGSPIANRVIPSKGAYKSRIPDLIQETVGGDSVAAEVVKDVSGYSPVEEQKIKDQVSKIQEKKKAILENKGFLNLGIGAKTESEVNAEYMALDKQEKILKSISIFKEIDKIDKLPQSLNYQAVDKKLKYLNKYKEIVEDVDLPEENKQKAYQAIAERTGLNKEQLDYVYLAKLQTESKTAFMKDSLDQATSNEERLNLLVNARTDIMGNVLLTSGVIDNLVDEGYLTYNEGRELKKYSRSADGTIKQTGRPSGSAKSSVKARKITIPKGRRIQLSTSKSKSRIKAILEPSRTRLKAAPKPNVTRFRKK